MFFITKVYINTINTSIMATKVCVLISSYDDIESDTKEFDNIECTPKHYFSYTDNYVFETHKISKKTSQETINALVLSKKYDVFFNLCDGAKDEDRAGVDVVLALEENNVPFTGAKSDYYELDKVKMKNIAKQYDITVPNHVVVYSIDNLFDACKCLKFPVIVKHISGYGSVGIFGNSKCKDFESLKAILPQFLKKYNVALIEEFIIGDEITVLVCQDKHNFEDKVKVFAPVKILFPQNVDFKFFEMKWITFNDMNSCLIDANYVSFDKIIKTAKNAFIGMMGGIGYGRCDLRVDLETGDVYFLEINPNCGIMYPAGQESSADNILLLDKTTNHKKFTIMQIDNAN
jgi:D-alanine-D-alanine ligase-like ATP-grasp enzyme